VKKGPKRSQTSADLVKLTVGDGMTVSESSTKTLKLSETRQHAYISLVASGSQITVQTLSSIDLRCEK
jgi:hypothetical protein